MDTVIEVKNLKKVYPAPRNGRSGKKNGQHPAEALGDVSFEVRRGEIFGLLGPNGAGKTTTLEIIEGIRHQTSGTVTVLGFDNLTQAPEIKRRIGVQLQSSAYLPYLTAGELLDLFASLYGRTADRAALLELVGLSDREDELVKNLSGGQQQRFAIASSLVNDPEILFLDEPTTGLDPQARRQLWQLVLDINRRGKTVVLTTHYMEEAEFLCHRVAIVENGSLLAIDEPKRLIDDLAHTTQVSFFSAAPLNQSFLQALPGVEKVYGRHPKVILEVSDLTNIAAVVQALKDRAVSFSGFTVKTASLEDVYLDLTGKEYTEQ